MGEIRMCIDGLLVRAAIWEAMAIRNHCAHRTDAGPMRLALSMLDLACRLDSGDKTAVDEAIDLGYMPWISGR